MKHFATGFSASKNTRLRASYVTVNSGIWLRRVSPCWSLPRLEPLDESRRLSQRHPCVRNVLQDSRVSSLTPETYTSGWPRNSSVYRV